MYIAGYLLTTDEEYSVHRDNIWAVLQCVENTKLDINVVVQFYLLGLNFISLSFGVW